MPLSFLLFALLAGSLLPQLEVGGILHCHDLFQTQRPEQRQFELKFRPECRIDCQNHKNNGINGQNRCALYEIGGDIGHHVHHTDDADQRNDWPKGNFECALRLQQTAAQHQHIVTEAESPMFEQMLGAAMADFTAIRRRTARLCSADTPAWSRTSAPMPRRKTARHRPFPLRQQPARFWSSFRG